jgi:tRNA(Ile)-lysidine synthase
VSLHPSVAAVRVAVRRTLTELVAERPGGRLTPDAAVLVACSGGPDSLALMSAAVFEGHRLGFRVIGVTIDHGLQDDSAAHAARVVEQMVAMGADETASARVQVTGGGRGPEAAAREARYAVLDEMVAHFGAVGVLLGHTLDDQAETVLLGLTRGSGGRSLAGMRRRFTHYRRPLLDVTRTDTVTACQVEGLEYWNDPHNIDPAYARVRVRRKVLPVLEDELGPGVTGTLARTADQLRADMELLDQLARSAYDDLRDADGLEVKALADLPPATRSRVLRLAALEAGATGSELFHVHVVALDQLLSTSRPASTVQLPGHVTAYLSTSEQPDRGGRRLQFRRTAVQG